MQTINIACPACRQSLKITPTLAPGTSVRCTGCGHVFGLPAITAAPPYAAAPLAISPGLEPAAPPRSGLALAVLFGLVLMLAAAGVGAVLYMNQEPPTDQRTASADTKPTDKDSPTGTPGTEKKNDTPGKPPVETVVRPDRSNPGKSPEPMPEPTPEPTPKPKPTPGPPPDRKPFETHLEPALQKQVDAAIDRGVAFLKARQGADGSWDTGSVRLAALPALTLLECGVPANDPLFARVVSLLRSSGPSLTATYDIAVTILFLDRFNDPADVPLIQTLALCLIAGQLSDGGWRYDCLNGPPSASEKDFLKALILTRPKNKLELFTDADGKLSPVLLGIRQEFLPAERFDPDACFKGDEAGRVIESLPAPCKAAPALTPLTKVPPLPSERDRSDNSNTQFGVLALLAAARHDVPVERALSLVNRRFRTSQNPVGGWAYYPYGERSDIVTPSMTGAGLLGLATGRGLLTDVKLGKSGLRLLDDAGVQRALRHAGKYIGRPLDGPRRNQNFEPEAVSLYFLWSLERVGVLFNLHKIEGKDWYLWAVQVLLPRQNKEGAWLTKNYYGSTDVIDTCLALLVLKRANLAKDLTVKINKLELIAEDKEKK